MEKTRIGIVGCGYISDIYLKNLTNLFREVEVTHVCDVIEEKARKAAKVYSVESYSTKMEELFDDPNVDMVLNLGRTFEHYEITKAAILAGKPVYSEKPLGITFEEGKELIELAKEKGVPIGCAPDTFLGSSFQTCRKVIEGGMIGEVLGASAFMVCPGHESWHPNPDFYYKLGGGPLLDMGPYYLTVLVNLLGGVKRVTGMAKKSFLKRKISSQPRFGDIIDVEVDTYVNGIVEFQNGAIGSIFTTFDVHNSQTPHIEIYGSEGTLELPDPDCFGGEIKLFRKETNSYSTIPAMFPYTENCRGLGVADMAKSIKTGREIRANGNQALHVLEVMCGIIRSSEEKRFIDIESEYSKPKRMISTNTIGILD
jgi:predicted dehydrogenase